MARLPRYGLPGQPHHVIQRGNNRCATFFAPADYGFFLGCLQEACLRYSVAIHAYVLMTNHVHLLATPTTADGLSKLMQSVGRRYVQHVNVIHGRSGTLWEGRYKAVPVDTEAYVMRCYRYIEANPVRAGMVACPSEYRWSSYACNAEGKADERVSPHALYEALGRDAAERGAAYRQLFSAEVDEAELSAIRHSVNKGWVLGSDGFASAIAGMASRRVLPIPRGGRREGAGRRKGEGSAGDDTAINRV